MRVGQRLFAAVVPAILGVFTVAGLAYWGRYAQSAPQWLVVVAVLASILSLILAWTNTRYIARRIESLARHRRSGMPQDSDELDDIEAVVDRLSEALAGAEASRLAAVAAAESGRREYAELISRASADVERELKQVRLPLHILLDNHFGDLNENQEEMLGAARAAADAADARIEQLKHIADLDLGR